jgi:serine/threonine protein phosphatase 1
MKNHTNLIPSTTGRLIAIGDIHGHSEVLIKLLDSIAPQEDDTIIFLGDLVNRGPSSKQVIDVVLELANKCSVYAICGNHEEMILAAYQGGSSEHNYWCKFGGIETLASYGVQNAKSLPSDHLLFIAECNDYLESEEFIFVHAGCDPDKHLSQNTGSELRWNFLDKNQKPHITGKPIVCGHSCLKDVFNIGHIICIDTGCGILEDGKLTAMDVKLGKIWQIDVSRKNLIEG